MINIPRKNNYTTEEVIDLVNKAYIQGSDDVCSAFEHTKKEQIIERVVNSVAIVFELSVDRIKSKSQNRDIIDAKKIIYHLLYPTVGTFEYIARLFHQHHSTVIFHYKSYDYLYINNSDFRKKAQRVQYLLKDE